jgi:hypothetical protein
MPPTLCRLAALSALVAALGSCVEPVEPAYDYQTGFYLVEGAVTDREGGSEVRVSRSKLEFDIYQLEAVNDAEVVSLDDAGNTVSWSRVNREGIYRPPAGFRGEVGREYRLQIATPEGNLIESAPERLPEPVGFANLRFSFNQEAYFSPGRDRFVPAFTFLVDLDDPAGTDNFYQFRYRTWQFTTICATCNNSVYRNGLCVRTPGSRSVDYYDYECSETCWTRREGNSFRLISDELNPGGDFSGLPVARLDYTGRGGLLLELEQRNLTRSAFAYFQILNDLTEGSAGLNAPLPAPLYGNLIDRSDAAVDVLGYVAATSVSRERVYWNRDRTDGTPLSLPRAPVYEPVNPSPPTAPCEGPNRTTERPAGWPL